MNTSQLSLNYGGKVIELPRGAIMGIVNATPDSFYAGSRREFDTSQKILMR